jgi:hypothetical protein
MENIEELFENDFFIKKNTSKEFIKQTEKIIGIKFPSDYLTFLENYDGGEGFTFNKQSYLILYGVSDITSINSNLHNELNYPTIFSRYIFIGKDAGPTYYGIEKFDKMIYQIPELISNESEIAFYSENFSSFLKLYSSNESF